MINRSTFVQIQECIRDIERRIEITELTRLYYQDDAVSCRLLDEALLKLKKTHHDFVYFLRMEVPPDRKPRPA